MEVSFLSKKVFYSFLVLASLFCLFHWPVVFGGKVYLNLWIFRNHAPFPPPPPHLYNFLNQSSDFVTHYFPYKYFAASYLKQGILPLWNPHVFCGFPLYANGSSAVFSPFNLSFLWLDPYGAYKVLLAVVFLLGGCLLFYYLVRFAKLSTAAGLCGSAALVFCPFLMENIDFDTLLGFVWSFPAVLIVGERLREKRRFSYAVPSLAFLLFAALLTSHVHVVVNTILLFAAYHLCTSWRGIPRRKRLLQAAFAGILFLGLGIFLLLPMAMFFRSSQWTQAAQAAFHWRAPLSFLTSVYPVFLKLPHFEEILGALGGGRFHFGYAVNVGYAPFLLSVVSILGLFHKGADSRFRVFAALNLFYHVLTVLPVGLWVPGGTGRFLETLLMRYWQIYVFSSAVLSAFAFQWIFTRPAFRALMEKVVWIFGLAVAAPVTASAFVFHFFHGLFRERLFEFTKAGRGQDDVYFVQRFNELFDMTRGLLDPLSVWILLPIFVTLSLGWVLLRLRSGAGGRFLRFFLLFAVVFELWVVGGRLKPVPVDRDWVYPRNSVVDFLTKEPEPFRILSVQSPPREAEGIQKYILKSNLGIPYGLSDVGGQDSVLDGAYLYFAKTRLAGKPIGEARNVGILDFEDFDLDAASFLNVKYILASDSHPLSREGLDPVLTADGLTVYENKKALPRIFFTAKHWLVVEDWKPDEVRLRLHNEEAGLLVYTDRFDPGWKAWDHGSPVKIEKVRGLFKGVFLEPGWHEIRFLYRPDAFYGGLWVSMGTAMLMVFLSLARVYYPKVVIPVTGLPRHWKKKILGNSKKRI